MTYPDRCARIKTLERLHVKVPKAMEIDSDLLERYMAKEMTLKKEQLKKRFFKKIENPLSKFDRTSTINALLQHSDYTPDHDFENYRVYSPWLISALIKWVLQYKDEKKGSEPTRQNIVDLINSTKRFDETAYRYSSPKTKDIVDIHQVFKSESFRQFRYQYPSSTLELPRQLLLLRNLPNKNSIDEVTLKIFGIEAQVLIDIFFTIFSAFLNKRCINETYFEKCSTKITNIFLKVLDYLSIDVKNCGSIIQNNEQDPCFDLNNPQPFDQCPFLKINGQYVCINHSILFTFLDRALYFILKGELGNRFTDPFGQAFQQHVGFILEKNEIEYEDLDKRKERERPKQFKADFIIDGHIILECKSANIPNSAKYTMQSDEMWERLEESIIHGIEQCLSTAALQKESINKELFIIIVTYEETFIDNYAAWCFGEKLDQLLKKYGDVVKKENIFVFSVRVLERVLLGKSKYDLEVGALLGYAAQHNHTGFAKGLPFSSEYIKGLVGHFDEKEMQPFYLKEMLGQITERSRMYFSKKSELLPVS